ncbi:MAG: hypothetical protein EB833_01475 [Thaumarchaeota archaeon S13]|nr:MAG: hypothetical protein EB833_01475 [Thaumarchaeota archaeon S13]
MVEIAEVATYVLGAVSATALSVGAKKAWSLDMRLSRTEDRVNDLHESHTKMSDSLSSLQRTSDKTCAQMEGLVKGMDTMNAKIDANSAQIVKLAVAQVEYGRAMGKIESGVEALSSRVGKIEGGVEALSSRVGKIEGGVLSSRMGTVEGGLKDLSSRMGTVEGGLKDLSSRMARFETRQDKQQLAIEDLKAGQDKQQLAIEDLKAGQDKQQATLERMERILMETVKRLSVQEVR